jgi:hypothetical protein
LQVSASKAVAGLVTFTAICVAAALLAPPIAQPLSYHDFADGRELLGVPRFADVVSNLFFLVAGIVGIAVVATRRAAFASPAERWPYLVFFAGLVLTSIGSAYYHLAPDNARLVWDRLPITATLAGLFLSQVADRIDVRAANALLVPAIAVGAGTVWYWQVTDNVVPYVIAQGYAAMATLAVALALPSRYTRGSDIYWAWACFVIAKMCEAFDRPIYRAIEVVSGHTLKHLAAAAAGLVICAMLARRVVKTEGAAT